LSVSSLESRLESFNHGMIQMIPSLGTSKHSSCGVRRPALSLPPTLATFYTPLCASQAIILWTLSVPLLPPGPAPYPRALSFTSSFSRLLARRLSVSLTKERVLTCLPTLPRAQAAWPLYLSAPQAQGVTVLHENFLDGPCMMPGGVACPTALPPCPAQRICRPHDARSRSCAIPATCLMCLCCPCARSYSIDAAGTN
jgi:hypothetical protein